MLLSIMGHELRVLTQFDIIPYLTDRAIRTMGRDS
jgi:hypothetical protein